MKKYERKISIIMLFVISISNLTTPVAYAAPLVKVHFTLPKNPVYDQSGLTKPPRFNIADQGSVLGATTSLFTVGTQKLDLSAGNQDSADRRIPLQVQQMQKKVYETTEDVTLAVVNPDNQPFTTTVTDVDNKAVAVPVSESNNGTTTTVDLAPSNQIKPGLYKVMISDGVKPIEQDFTWGVLALNTDKSMYHPGEQADIAMAVLNDNGEMVCDAGLRLRVTSSESRVDDTLTTDASSSANMITVNPQCQKHDFSLEPDYEAHYKFATAGNYQFQLTATTSGGTHTITDTIQVKDAIAFDVQRVSATRIYPPNTYPMLFNITANRDFNGIVTETVPDSFTITPATQSAAQSYTGMQTVYLNSNDPAALMSQQIASTSGGLVMPFHGSYPITQGFGAQLTDPTLQAFYTHYGLGGHDGIDFGVPMNTPLYAVDAGTIVWSGPGDYGTMVTIKHSWGQTYYGHMTNTSVAVGQQVDKGQLIGYSGMTGEATGPHLHFGMKPANPDMTNGYYGKIDPMPFLPIGQGEPITALGASNNPVENLVYNTTVLGASDSAATPTPTDVPSDTPTPTGSNPVVTQMPTGAPTVSPTPSNGRPTSSPTVSVTPVSEAPTPTTAPSVFDQPTKADNTTFSVLNQQIKINEQIANDALTQKVKVITWNVHLKKGQSTSLGYAYKAPHVSPQFYLLGPAKFYSGGDDRIVFQEARQWQIASDDVGVEWYNNTTGNKWNGYSWGYRKKVDILSGTKATNLPTLDQQNVTNSAASVAFINISLTITSNANRLLVVVADSCGALNNISSVQLNGSSTGWNRLDSIESSVGAGDEEMWYLVAPSSGAATIRINQTASNCIDGQAMSFYNVNQASPLGTDHTSSHTTASTSLSNTITTTANQLVLDSFWSTNGATSSFVPSSPQTAIWTATGFGQGSYQTSTGTSTTVTWTYTSDPGVEDMGVGINPTGVTYANFPVLVSLAGDPGLKAHAQANCNDVVFTDSTGKNKLNYEIENSTTPSTDCTSGNLTAWVNISSLSATSDSIIYMYYGNPSTASQANAASTWNSSYISAWHLSDNAATTTITDSTGTYNLTNAANTSGKSTSGEIANGLTYNGSSDTSNKTSVNLSSTSQVSISFWINRTWGTPVKSIVETSANPNSNNAFGIDADDSNDCTSGSIYVIMVDGSSHQNDPCYAQPSSGTWHLINVVLDRSEVQQAPQITLYIDGAPKNPSKWIQTTANTGNFSTQTLFVGARNGLTPFIAMTLDEMRLATTALTGGWIQTEYTNESAPSSFSTLGSEETDIFSPTLDKLMRHGEWFDSTGTVQPFVF